MEAIIARPAPIEVIKAIKLALADEEESIRAFFLLIPAATIDAVNEKLSTADLFCTKGIDIYIDDLIVESTDEEFKKLWPEMIGNCLAKMYEFQGWNASVKRDYTIEDAKRNFYLHFCMPYKEIKIANDTQLFQLPHYILEGASVVEAEEQKPLSPKAALKVAKFNSDQRCSTYLASLPKGLIAYINECMTHPDNVDSQFLNLTLQDFVKQGFSEDEVKPIFENEQFAYIYRQLGWIVSQHNGRNYDPYELIFTTKECD
jgi:hypothetical protein